VRFLTCQHGLTLAATTLKRHIYYCRSKKKEASRKKSCVSCIRAKTRCSWPAGPGEVTCVRCQARGSACEYEHPNEHGQKPHRPVKVLKSSQTDGILGDEPAEIDVSIETVTPDVTNHPSMLDSSWDSSLTPSSQSSGGIIGFYNDKDIDSWDLMAIDSCLSALRPQSLASTALFHTRPFTQPTQTSCVSLAMRILRSYPSMMSRDGGLPPFVSPQLYSGKQPSHAQSQVSLDMLATADRANLCHRHWPLVPILPSSSDRLIPTRPPCGRRSGSSRSASRLK
jgi:hypothetical protein